MQKKIRIERDDLRIIMREEYYALKQEKQQPVKIKPGLKASDAIKMMNEEFEIIQHKKRRLIREDGEIRESKHFLSTRECREIKSKQDMWFQKFKECVDESNSDTSDTGKWRRRVVAFYTLYAGIIQYYGGKEDYKLFQEQFNESIKQKDYFKLVNLKAIDIQSLWDEYIRILGGIVITNQEVAPPTSGQKTIGDLNS